MLIQKNVSLTLQGYKAAQQISLPEMAKKLGIATSSLQCYIKGTSDLRASTIEILSDKMNIPLTEMIFGPAPEWKRAEILICASRELADLSAEQRDQGIQLLLQLVELFAGDT